MRQQKLAELVSKGGTILVCQVCEKVLKFQESDLIPGIKLSTDLVASPCSGIIPKLFLVGR
jgi:hypothetical protein